MGDVKVGPRTRAVGARDAIMSRLKTVGEVTHPDGLASNVLAEAVGYPGSSVAFAQLLSGMEKAGLIERDIRGRRTYRIRLAGGATVPPGDAHPGDAHPGARVLPPPASALAARLMAADEGRREPGPGDGVGTDVGIDYDKLATRLLVQVVRRLATPSAGGPGSPAGSAPPAGPAEPEPGPQSGQADLAKTVASLKRKLASIESRQRKLSAENARLREQLAEAQQSLADSRDAARSGRLDATEMQMLESLLSSLQADPVTREDAQAG